ncbi:MAG: tetratricopeptide repeat protein [Methyloceanibacter sp.]
MAKLIRCPSGHVYDKTAHEVCPECARAAVPEAEAGGEPETAPVRDSKGPDAKDERKPAPKPWLAIGGAALALLAIAGFFLLRPSGDTTKETPQATAESTPSTPADAKSDPDYQTCDAGSGDGVIPACDRAIQSGRFSGADLATLYRDRAIERTGKDDVDGAIDDYTEALRIDAKNIAAFNDRGELYRRKGDYDRAIEDYGEAIALDPKQPVPINNRGLAYESKGEHGRAIADFDAAIGLDPTSAKYLANRGNAYRAKGEPGRAKEDYTKALSLNPDADQKQRIEAALAELGSASPAAPADAAKSEASSQPATSAKPAEPPAAPADAAKSEASNQPATSDKPAETPSAPADAAKSEASSQPGTSDKPAETPSAPSASKAADASAQATGEPAPPAPGEAKADPKADPDFKACVTLGESTFAICDKAIASGKFSGPALASLYVGRGVGQLSAKNATAAISDFSEAIELDPDEPVAYNNRGAALRQTGERDKALADLDQAIKLDPNYASAFNNRGLVYADRREYDRAIQDLSQAIALDSNYLKAYKNRGDAYRRKGEKSLATADYNKALALNPSDDVKKQINAALYALGSAPTASPEPASAAAESPAKTEDQSPALAISDGPTQAKAPEQAASSADAKADPDYRDCVEFLDSPAETAAACGRAIASGKFGGGDLAVLYYNRSIWRDVDGDLDAALADAAEAIRLVPDNADYLSNRGTIYLSKDTHDKAIEDFNHAIKLDPKLEVAFHNRGIAYIGKGDYDRAIEDLSQAIAIGPRDSLHHKLRGDAYVKRGDRDSAAEDYKKALTLKTDNKTRAEIETALKELESAPAGGATGQSAQPQPAASTADPKADPDYQACSRPKGDPAACDRAIASGGFSGVDLGTLYRYRAFGRAHGDKPDLEGALADYTEAVRLDPQSFIPYALRSEVYRDKGELESEIKDLDRAIALNPRADFYDQRGNALRRLGNLDRALEDLNHAIELDQSYFGTYWNRGLAYQAKGDRERAAEDYKKALTLKPTEEAKQKIEASLKGLGSSTSQTPEQAAPPANEKAADYGGKAADEDFVKCTKRDGSDAGAACNRVIASGLFSGSRLATLYISRGFMPPNKMPDKTKSLEANLADFNEAIKLDPGNAVGFMGRGRAYIEKRDYDRGLKDIDEALKLDPKSASALHWRGVAYVGQKDYDRAIEAFDQALHIDAKLLNSYFFRAVAYAKKGDREHAIADYKMALSLNPDDQLRRLIEKSLKKLDSDTSAPDKKSEAPSSGGHAASCVDPASPAASLGCHAA